MLRKRKPEELAGLAGDDEIVVIEGIDVDGNILMLEAKPHDINRWPHLYPAQELEVMFPLVIAAADIEAPSEAELNEHRTLHERWATRRPLKDPKTTKKK